MTTEPRIHVLPGLLVRKIAAGEVVERPASVVKELVENAVDAGARRVAVTIENGGRDLIRVSDDGCGMSPEELRLAVTPHATSKIRIEDDLYAIGTLGFRGEALASISAVSKLRMVSRTADTVEGHEVLVAGESLEASRAAGCPLGTTIEVRDLFFNVPARRKFLRAGSTEVGHINEQIARVALPDPQAAFKLTHNNRVTRDLPACGDRRERIRQFYGSDLAEALLHVRRDERGIGIEAFMAPPVQSRATTQWQYAFVNGRFIRDRYVMHAIKEAYRGLTEPNRHGVVFLFITLDPKDVDVNVHPTKIEVRWADSNLIHSLTLSALRETFQRGDITPALRTDRARREVDPAQQDRIRREVAEMMRSMDPTRTAASRSPGGDWSRGGSQGPSADGGGAALDPGQLWRSLYGAPGGATGGHGTGEIPGDRFAAPGDAGSTAPDDPTAGRLASPPDGSRPRAIQMHNLYLVVETADGILIIDQHALHERVIFEQLSARFRKGPLESQRLLLPETIAVTTKQLDRIETHADLLRRLGIEVTPFGTDSVAVQAFPVALKDTDVPGFLHDLLDRLNDHATQPDPEASLNDILSMMACKAAVKAGDSLTAEEIEALIRQRHLIDKATSCPHGRPTMLRLTKSDLNRQFHRT